MMKNISWNINGILRVYTDATGMRTTGYRCPQFIADMAEMNPDIALFQEPVGANFEGYDNEKEWQCAAIPNMTKFASDNAGMTATCIKNSFATKYQPIPIPSNILQHYEQKTRVYSSAVKLYINGKNRNRNHVV